MSYDNTAKYLAELYPAEFAKWLLPDKDTEVTVLKTELSIDPICADYVIFLQTIGEIFSRECANTTANRKSWGTFTVQI